MGGQFRMSFDNGMFVEEFYSRPLFARDDRQTPMHAKWMRAAPPIAVIERYSSPDAGTKSNV
jgi:hypothetical protein